MLVFVDDTGHESLAPGHLVYGLGGCAVLASDLDSAIRQPWRGVRQLVTGSIDTPLHASDFSRNATQEQIAAIAAFFKQPTFMRFAAVASVATQHSNRTQLIDVVLQLLGQRIQELSGRVPLREAAVIFEHSCRAKKLIEKYFSAFVIERDTRPIPTELCWMPKSANEPSLEVADFVMHAVQHQMRHSLKGRVEFLLDFQAVFMDVPSRLVSFMRVDRVTGVVPTEMVEGHELRPLPPKTCC